MVNSPKINLIYYKNILDNIFYRFFQEYNDRFTRVNGKYVFSDGINRSTFSKKIEEYFFDEINSLTEDFNLLNPNYYFIIGSCFPQDNMLLEKITDEKSSTKIHKAITKYPYMKYFIKEKDLVVDNEIINGIFEDMFTRYFENRKLFLKKINPKKSKIFLIKNSRLDCYSLYRVIKDMFGRVNVINIHKKNIDRMQNVFKSINEIIGSCVLKKKEICRDTNNEWLSNTKKCIQEYINNCIENRI